MSKIVSIAWKDNLVRFSSWTELLFFLILPVVFTLFIGGGIGGSDEPDAGDNPIPVLVVDNDGGDLAAALLTQLESEALVQVETVTEAEAESRFSDGEVPAVLTIDPGFSTDLQSGKPVILQIQKLPENPQADAAERLVQTAAGTTGSAVEIARSSVAAAGAFRPFASAADEQRYFTTVVASAEQRIAARPERVVSMQAAAAEVDSEGFDLQAFAAAGQLVTWVFIPLLGASGIFVYERVLGTMRRLVTTPTGRATFLLGTISGQLGAGILQMTILISVSALLFGVNWGSSPLSLAILVVTFGLAAVAMGTALGTFLKTESQASGVSIMFGMSMALLGGCWFPIETFPPAVQQAVRVLPTTWAMSGFSDIVLRGQGVTSVLPEAGVLLGFAALFFTIGVWRFRYE